MLKSSIRKKKCRFVRKRKIYCYRFTHTPVCFLLQAEAGFCLATDTFLSHSWGESIMPTCCHIVPQLIVLLICSAHIRNGELTETERERGLDRRTRCAGGNHQKCAKRPNQQSEKQGLYGRKKKKKGTEEKVIGWELFYTIASTKLSLKYHSNKEPRWSCQLRVLFPS